MIAAGTKFGPYEITGAIGAGGMGEVYRARDTRLERIVAVKILPDHLSDRAELRERFEREARTIASLNHPHICTLYDIGQQDGTDFLVMEYLEGETLAERLKKGPLPLAQVLQYAVEISDALDKAHRKGITHRDLKPGNIMLAKSGAKLLDFGLAKLKALPTASPLSQLPTANDTITAQGTILGTLQYMAPEQLEGKEADARTDIFAFGVIVYEMATGKKAFEGKSQASLIAKILETDPPPMSSLQPMTPPALDRVVKKCLAKEPEKRWQGASDLCDELKWVSEGGSQVTLAPTTGAKGISALGRRALFLSLGTLLLGGAITGLAVWNLKPSPSPKPVSRLTITLPPGDQLGGLNEQAIALSPDGSQLAYVAIRGGRQQIYLRALNSLEARPITGTDGATDPFFSPDGQWLGFFAAGRLKKVPTSGGAAQILGDAAVPTAAVPTGASWGTQGTIAFTDATGALQQVPDAGGAPQPLTRLEKTDTVFLWPEFLPGSRAVLFAVGSAVNTATMRVAVYSIGKGERRDLIQGATQPQYALSGQLVYAQQGTLMAVPFDPQRLTITGAAVPVVEGVLQSTFTGAAQYGISAVGSLVYIPGVQVSRRLVWVGRNGAEQPLTAAAHAYDSPRISPGGRQIAVSMDGQIWLYDLSRDTLTRLTFAGDTNNRPAWTPDGKRIAFMSNKEGQFNIFWLLADGSGGLERLSASENLNAPTSFSPDGQLLAFNNVNATQGDIWVLRLSDPGTPGQARKAQPFLSTPFNKAAARFSPDGHWLAYVSAESGRYEVYVQPFPGPGGKWQISTEGGAEPAWNPNGRELFYRSADKMMAVEVTTQPSFAVGKPRVLFTGEYVSSLVPIANYDVSPDGQRFLMVKETEKATSITQIVVVQNWFEELKQKVPTGKK